MNLTPPPDHPLHFDESSRPFGAEVVDLNGVRIRFGRPTVPAYRQCQHRQMLYSKEERRVWCEDCNRTIDNFEAVMTLISMWQGMERAVRGKREAAEEAEKATLNRRAAKNIDKEWSGRCMAVACVHCGGGLLPEDYDRGVPCTSREIELARRQRLTPSTPSPPRP